MTDSYIDPPNWLEITDEMRAVKTLGDVKAIADRVFPGLIIGTFHDFSKDYSNLYNNWVTLCKKLQVQPVGIMLFKNWEPDEKHKLVAHIAECFTKAGFFVRTDFDMQLCTKCSRVIPTEIYHNVMVTKGIQLPPWSPKCTTC